MICTERSYLRTPVIDQLYCLGKDPAKAVMSKLTFNKSGVCLTMHSGLVCDWLGHVIRQTWRTSAVQHQGSRYNIFHRDQWRSYTSKLKGIFLYKISGKKFFLSSWWRRDGQIGKNDLFTQISWKKWASPFWWSLHFWRPLKVVLATPLEISVGVFTQIITRTKYYQIAFVQKYFIKGRLI